jgi:hypothetical protein
MREKDRKQAERAANSLPRISDDGTSATLWVPPELAHKAGTRVHLSGVDRAWATASPDEVSEDLMTLKALDGRYERRQYLRGQKRRFRIKPHRLAGKQSAPKPIPVHAGGEVCTKPGCSLVVGRFRPDQLKILFPARTGSVRAPIAQARARARG